MCERCTAPADRGVSNLTGYVQTPTPGKPPRAWQAPLEQAGAFGSQTAVQVKFMLPPGATQVNPAAQLLAAVQLVPLDDQPSGAQTAPLVVA
jgi:hypothetical protein